MKKYAGMESRLFFGLVLLSAHRLCVAVNGSDTQIIYTAIGGLVELECFFMEMVPVVLWFVPLGLVTCTAITKECTKQERLSSQFQGSINATLSTLRISIISDTPEGTYLCSTGSGKVLKEYNITIIDPKPPRCHMVPFMESLNQSEVSSVKLYCESAHLHDISVGLEIRGIENGVWKPSEGIVIKRIVHVDTLINATNATCEMAIPQLDITRNCVFPRYAQVREEGKKSAGIFKCDVEFNDNQRIKWFLSEFHGEKVNISERSWIKNKGEFLMLRNITGDDVGRVIGCRVYNNEGNSSAIEAIGFSMIEAESESFLKVEEKNDITAPYNDITLIALCTTFALLWFITLIAFIVWNVKSSKQVKTIQSSSRPNPRVQSRGPAPQLGGRDDSSDTSTFEGRHMIFNEENENNSAGSTSKTRDAGGMSNLQQDYENADDRIYFCVDRSSPASPSRLASCRGERNSERTSLSERDSAGYDLVKAPLVLECNVDERSEYDEVSNLRGKDEENVPLRENPRRDKYEDIASLYSKVSK